MKKLIAGVLALTLVTSTVVFADNSMTTKKQTVSCSQGCPKPSTCTAGSSCAAMPGCVCN